MNNCTKKSHYYCKPDYCIDSSQTGFEWLNDQILPAKSKPDILFDVYLKIVKAL